MSSTDTERRVMTPEEREAHEREIFALMARLTRDKKKVTPGLVSIMATLVGAHEDTDMDAFQEMVWAAKYDWEGFANLCDKLAAGGLPRLQKKESL